MRRTILLLALVLSLLAADLWWRSTRTVAASSDTSQIVTTFNGRWHGAWSRDAGKAASANDEISITFRESCVYKVLSWTDQDVSYERDHCDTNIDASGGGTDYTPHLDCSISGGKPKCSMVDTPHTWTYSAKKPSSNRTRVSLAIPEKRGSFNFDGFQDLIETRTTNSSGEQTSAGGGMALVAAQAWSDRAAVKIAQDPVKNNPTYFPMTVSTSSLNGSGHYSSSWGGANGSGSVELNFSVSGGAKPDETEVELVPADGYDQWMPQAGKDEKTVGNYLDVEVVAHKKDDPYTSPPKQVKKYTITLENTSREQGVDLNWPSSMAGAKATKDYDFRIDPKNALVKVIDDDGQRAETTQEKLTDFKVRLNSYDWGAYTTLKVVAEFSDGSTVTAHIHGGTSESLNAPQDDNENHIADCWEKNWGLTGAQADADDDDVPVGDGHKGDSIPLYDEYRGFHIGGNHERLSPITKDLFILDSAGLGGGVYSASTNVAVHLVKSVETDISPGGAGAQDYVTANGHGEKVYAILLLNKAIEAGVVGQTNGGPSIPENIESIWIDAALCARVDGGPGGPELKSTIAHELGHATNVRHHGQGPDYEISSVVCVPPGGARVVHDCPNDPDHPGRRLNCFGVAGKGGMYSGNDTCPMRYESTDYYPNQRGECISFSGGKSFSPYGQDPPGMGMFCSNPAGTGVNDPSRNPTKAGDATLGRCAAQIRLKK